MMCSDPKLMQESEVPHSSGLPGIAYCPVCFELITEPVVYPCVHEVCKACFEQCVATGNLHCPVCRHRISSWARRSKRNGCVVDEARQRKIAESLQEALGSGDVARHPSPMMSADPVRVLYPPGQLEREYRTELKKMKEEEEEQIQRDKEHAKRLQKEEDTMMMAQWKQIREDESLALKLSQEGQHHSEAVVGQRSVSSPEQPQPFLSPDTRKRPVQDREGSSASKRLSCTTPRTHRRKSESTGRPRKTQSPDTSVHIGTLFSQERERLADLDYRLALRVRESLRSEERGESRSPSGNVGGLQGRTKPAATILKFFAKKQS